MNRVHAKELAFEHFLRDIIVKLMLLLIWFISEKSLIAATKQAIFRDAVN